MSVKSTSSKKMVFFDLIGLPIVALEIVVVLTITLILFKIVYNVGHFIYTTFLGNLLGAGIQVKNCGPMAGDIYIYIYI